LRGAVELIEFFSAFMILFRGEESREKCFPSPALPGSGSTGHLPCKTLAGAFGQPAPRTSAKLLVQGRASSRAGVEFFCWPSCRVVCYAIGRPWTSTHMKKNINVLTVAILSLTLLHALAQPGMRGGMGGAPSGRAWAATWRRFSARTPPSPPLWKCRPAAARARGNDHAGQARLSGRQIAF